MTEKIREIRASVRRSDALLTDAFVQTLRQSRPGSRR
jgi:hypothetical protein